jgi:hypothetical protein
VRTFSKLLVAFLFSPLMERAMPRRLLAGMSSGMISKILSLRVIASFQLLLTEALMASCSKSCVLSLFMLDEILNSFGLQVKCLWFLLCSRLLCYTSHMSGHSKWSTIKHQKAVEDSKRSSVFTKIAKKIHIAVKKGGIGDPNANPYLRACIDEARSVNMPMENIKRAIDKALGATGADSTEEVIYEAYGPGGVGMTVTAVTDNRNRTSG